MPDTSSQNSDPGPMPSDFPEKIKADPVWSRMIPQHEIERNAPEYWAKSPQMRDQYTDWKLSGHGDPSVKIPTTEGGGTNYSSAYTHSRGSGVTGHLRGSEGGSKYR